MIWFKGENLNMTIEFTIIESLKYTFFTFWTKFTKNGYFQCKTEKLEYSSNLAYFYLPNFTLNKEFFFCSKRVEKILFIVKKTPHSKIFN